MELLSQLRPAHQRHYHICQEKVDLIAAVLVSRVQGIHPVRCLQYCVPLEAKRLSCGASDLIDSFVDKVEEALKSRETHARIRGERSRNSIVPSALLGIGLATAVVSFGLFPWSAWVAACALLTVGAGVIPLSRRVGDGGR